MTLLMLLLALAPADQDTTWGPAYYDIYVDGQQQSGLMVWRNGGKLLLDINKGGRLVLLERGDDSVYAVGTTARANFSFVNADAKGPDQPKVKKQGKATRLPENQIYFSALGKSVVMTPHQGPTGTLSSEADIYTHVPAWQHIRDAYKPDEALVDVFKQIDTETTFHIYFGTWCGDSRRDVTRLFQTLKLADNPKLKVAITAVQRGFAEPADVIREKHLTNVPTIDIHQGDTFVGRYLERPTGDSSIADMADLLQAKTPEAKPIAEDDLIGSGVMLQKDDAGNIRFREHWTLKKNGSGKQLLVKMEGDAEIHIKLSLNDENAPTFIELTRFAEGDIVSRTRTYLRSNKLTASQRGNAAGLVRQTLALEAIPYLDTPSMTANALTRQDREATHALSYDGAGWVLKKAETLTITWNDAAQYPTKLSSETRTAELVTGP